MVIRIIKAFRCCIIVRKTINNEWEGVAEWSEAPHKRQKSATPVRVRESAHPTPVRVRDAAHPTPVRVRDAAHPTPVRIEDRTPPRILE